MIRSQVRGSCETQWVLSGYTNLTTNVFFEHWYIYIPQLKVQYLPHQDQTVKCMFQT